MVPRLTHGPDVPASGRLTLPVEEGIDAEIREIFDRLGADAVRNSDGTHLPEMVKDLAAKVYATYFPARGDQEWSRGLTGTRVHQFLMSARHSATSTTLEDDGRLVIDPLRGYFALQLQPELDCDTAELWQVIDRTTGAEVLAADWRFRLHLPGEGTVEVEPGSDLGRWAHIEDWNRTPEGPRLDVVVLSPDSGHEYTVGFLARQIWDSTQMYNYLTNDWENDPERYREYPYDVRLPEVWEHTREGLAQWLTENPHVDVVRFTTFFYHFTIAYNDEATEKFVDWFGYSASVSVPALEAFAEQYGYRLRPEDFIDAGYYNNAFRPPSRAFRDWIDFTSSFVAERAGELVDLAHAEGREAMMFLGDNWIGTEPYGEHFAKIGLDAVVGSVGSAATCRMISDIPSVTYTEGRFLPYFFPDVFRPGGDPAGEARESWVAARRAISRCPLSRMGYGGYLSLALQHPDFLAEVTRILQQFRQISAAHAAERALIEARAHSEDGVIVPGAGGARPGARRSVSAARSGAATAPFTVAVLNAWGALRSWQTHMVSHAQWYRQTYSHIGVLESLAGLPFNVEFVSFDDLVAGRLGEDVKVLINAGAAGTSYSGGQYWADPEVVSAVRRFVDGGGGLIGVGHPSAVAGERSLAQLRGLVQDAGRAEAGSFFALSDVFGVDLEQGFGLSGRYPASYQPEHFITRDLPRGEVAASAAQRVDDGGLPDPSQAMGANPRLMRALPTFMIGEEPGFIHCVDPSTRVLARRQHAPVGSGPAAEVTMSVDLAAHEYGRGRAVYFSGLPFDAVNSRLLHRALYWAAGAEDLWGSRADVALVCDNPLIEITHFPGQDLVLASNLDLASAQVGRVSGVCDGFEVSVPAGGVRWITLV